MQLQPSLRLKQCPEACLCFLTAGPGDGGAYCENGGQTTGCNIDRGTQVAVILAVVMAACYFSVTYVLLICKLRGYQKLAYTAVQSSIVFNTLQVRTACFLVCERCLQMCSSCCVYDAFESLVHSLLCCNPLITPALLLRLQMHNKAATM